MIVTAYCVSYDLNKTGQNYNALYEELKKSPNWCHPLDSTWLIVTSESPQELANRLRKHMDDNDGLLVIRVTSDHAGWLSQEVWDWINENIR